MKIIDLFAGTPCEVVYGDLCGEYSSLIYDSRKVEEGCVFVCIKGANFDAHDVAEDAAKRKAAAIVMENEEKAERLAKTLGETKSETKIFLVKSTRNALSTLAAAHFGNPASRLLTIGITGTKGKTTTSYMVRETLLKSGIPCGLIGTIEIINGQEIIPSKNTTPESYVVQESFKKMADAGMKACVMEVSSQALMMGRVAGVNFDIGVFTNLSPDHIGDGEHKDFEDYKNCKKALFAQCKKGIFNADDVYFKEMSKDAKCEVITFGHTDSDFKASDVKLENKGSSLGVSFKLSGKVNNEIYVDVPGDFSVHNALAATAVAVTAGCEIDAIKASLSDIKVKGRVERVETGANYTMLIDYAHNGMSLESILTTLRAYNPKRLVCLFGCGGNRAKDRRFEMGEVSSRLADLTIVTSDNPRFEEPEDIIKDILVGVKRASGKYVTIADRREAIKYIIDNHEDGDVVVLAGKGHEDYQEIRGVKYPMDERVIVEEILNGIE